MCNVRCRILPSVVLGTGRAEHEDFITCIAAPIHDADGAVVAALSISVPNMLLPAEDVAALLPQLLEAAAIEADLRQRPDPDQ